ncbi:uncharacterized protein PAC_19396 [Phialocephala subalpina]|uniref:DUF1365 domain protein n=1 Tax=Phialocephala subalpina TaxID=576137 RepID=A0A1L7XWT8_9HELO|nr:uncharacterized protein PAC_19396 [Phialocephala subalpina]
MESFISTLVSLITISTIHTLGGSLDLILLVVFKTYAQWNSVQQFIEATINPAIVIEVAKHVSALFAILHFTRFFRGLFRSDASAIGSCLDSFPVKPLFFPCQTSHVRMFPKKHGFSYSYLFVGIPIGWKGNSGGMVSAEEEDSRSWLSLNPGKAWWTVNGDDYLKRGHVKDGLVGKVREYLESQGVDHEQYAYAYLITAAKFLGYASNPVSIWHLYSAEKELKALVLEVNNTSDERHVYFLEPNTQTLPPKEGQDLEFKRYTGSWSKDFYVSTFSDRAGKYSAAVYDPLFPFMSRSGSINCTITLSSADQRPMLIARVYSAGQALDPSSMSIWAKIKFLASWWWVGFMTFFPRTVYQAFILFFRKGMAWVSRPEPRKETTPRHAHPAEVFIDQKFRQFLRERVIRSKEEIVLQYTPAGLVGPSASSERIARRSVAEPHYLELRVLTPAFYSRIAEYADIYVGLLKECRSQTISISDLDLLTSLNFGSGKMQGFSEVSWAGVYFGLIERLRVEVPAIPLLEKPDPEAEGLEVPPYSLHGTSGFDRYVAATASREEEYQYASGVLKLVCAERFAWGWMEILNLEIFLLRVCLAWLLVKFVLP